MVPTFERQAPDRRPVPFGLKLFGKALRLAGADKILSASEAEIVAAQKPFPHNFLTNAIFGKMARGVTARDERFGRGLTVRIYEPADRPLVVPCVLYMHGGGWVSGDPGITDWWCSELAKQAGIVVASVDYRLAPLHRFPAGLMDCYRALRWLADHHAALRIDPDQIGVAGDSAGANLAAALCLLARERGGPAIAHQTLIYPALDLTLSSPSVAENADAPILSADACRAFAGHYLGPQGGARDPLASPLFAEDLSDLPPALIQVAEHDPLRDDGWRYAKRLEAAGVPVRITEYAGAPHGFATFPGVTNIARRSLDEVCAYQAAPSGQDW